MKAKTFYVKALYTSNDVVTTVTEHHNSLEDFMRNVDVVQITQSSTTVCMGFKFTIVTAITVWYEEKEIPHVETDVAQSLYGKPIDELNLSRRVSNALCDAGITSLGELCQKTERELERYWKLGFKSRREIKDKLEIIGLGLGMSLPPRQK